MKNTNISVDVMVYASLFGNSLFLAFGKCLHAFRKTFTPAKGSIKKEFGKIWEK